MVPSTQKSMSGVDRFFSWATIYAGNAVSDFLLPMITLITDSPDEYTLSEDGCLDESIKGEKILFTTEIPFKLKVSYETRIFHAKLLKRVTCGYAAFF